MSTSDNWAAKMMRQVLRDEQVGRVFPLDYGTLRRSYSVGKPRPPEYLSDLEKLRWQTQDRTTSSGNPFANWHTDPDDYSLDQLCLFEEDDSWQQKRSRLMEWLDQRSGASSTTEAGLGTTPSQRW